MDNNWRKDPDFVSWLIMAGHCGTTPKGQPRPLLTESTIRYMHEAFAAGRGIV